MRGTASECSVRKAFVVAVFLRNIGPAKGYRRKKPGSAGRLVAVTVLLNVHYLGELNEVGDIDVAFIAEVNLVEDEAVAVADEIHLSRVVAIVVDADTECRQAHGGAELISQDDHSGSVV